MKTTTYLRLSLLLPFLVWGLCVLFFIIWSALDLNGLETSGAHLPSHSLRFGDAAQWRAVPGNVIPGLILWTVLFYVFGILGWFLPYLLLSLILLVWSFRSRAEVLMKVFALAPIAMAILIVVFMSILSLGSQDWNMFSSNSATNLESIFGSQVWFAILALVWGYICVGLGLGIYRLLQHRRIIRDEANRIELASSSII